MSFLNEKIIFLKSEANPFKKNKRRIILQTCPRPYKGGRSLILCAGTGKTSFFASCAGSMSVEAALAMPIFLFAILNLLSMMEIYDVQMRLQAALHQTAREMAVEGHAFRLLQGDGGTSTGLPVQVAFSESYVRSRVQSYVTKETLSRSVIENGCGGMLYSFSRIMEDDRIELRVVYRIAPRFSLVPFGKVWTMSQAKARAFTGYDSAKAARPRDGEEAYVYVTECGTAYHMDRSCSHLQLTIQLVTMQEAGILRNDEGGKYYPCELCCEGSPGSEVVLITNLGNRYHRSAACSGLKRTIRMLPLNEAGAYHPCSRCAFGS